MKKIRKVRTEAVRKLGKKVANASYNLSLADKAILEKFTGLEMLTYAPVYEDYVLQVFIIRSLVRSTIRYVGTTYDIMKAIHKNFGINAVLDYMFELFDELNGEELFDYMEDSFNWIYEYMKSNRLVKEKLIVAKEIVYTLDEKYRYESYYETIRETELYVYLEEYINKKES